ncbi:damage-inducible protein CinA [Chryseobacterium sp. Leaf180]|uniref:CinA family protein n=1 Tax=Chryseobacterium sp. Leaf180 TaxID=1736289 RepID=UPI0006FC4BEC|nr:CinA family protein [Chryseobacterium sp. Leaf180]KQR94630.1 damage-inducible protein CinA [Chryseobacterium sp. Leaf180]
MEFQKKLLDFISQTMITSKETISVAESVTSGLLQLAFSQMPNASSFYSGGLTAFTLEQKVNLLKVNENAAKKSNCVSEDISGEMALNVAKIFKTDWSVAVTGYCSPVKESIDKIFSYFSFSYKGEVILSKKLELHPRTESLDAQMYFSEFILGCLKSEMRRAIILR